LNRDQKAAAIEEIAGQIRESQAVFAVDPTGLSVGGAAEVRTKLRDADTTLRVVKNTLTERAADQAEAEQLKELLAGATALAFVRGDVAAAAKALADYQRDTDLLPFKGGMMEGGALSPADIVALSKLPSREVLIQQLVLLVASPISGLARTLNALPGGLAIALGQIQQKMEAGELPSGAAPAAAAEAAEQTEAAPAADTDDQDAEAPAEPTTSDEPAEGAATPSPDTDTAQEG
jgi:large subunit ribosomal protein L10